MLFFSNKKKRLFILNQFFQELQQKNEASFKIWLVRDHCDCTYKKRLWNGPTIDYENHIDEKICVSDSNHIDPIHLMVVIAYSWIKWGPTLKTFLNRMISFRLFVFPVSNLDRPILSVFMIHLFFCCVSKKKLVTGTLTVKCLIDIPRRILREENLGATN